LVTALRSMKIYGSVIEIRYSHIFVPKNFQKIARPRMQQLIIAKTYSGTRMLQKGSCAGTVGIEYPKWTLPI
ncbi:MAG: hypothetical protein ACR2OF_02050, partial [Hyphomicrobium sp.]